MSEPTTEVVCTTCAGRGWLTEPRPDSTQDRMSGPTVTQILIFHPDCGERPAPRPTRTPIERTADRQRYINLELERVQVDDLATVREIVLGTNNFVYAVIDYPAAQSEEGAA